MVICPVSVSQTDEVLRQVPGQSASIPCHVNHSCLNPFKIHWFVVSEDACRKLDTQPYKYSLETEALKINYLQANDSGIYHCAAFHTDVVSRGSQTIGRGTTLLVEESWMQISWYVLCLLFVLLVLYSLALLILVICKKTGHRSSRKVAGSSRNTKNTTQKIQFGAVVQELYGKRKLRKNENSEVIASPQNQVESPNSNIPDEDIYQNL